MRRADGEDEDYFTSESEDEDEDLIEKNNETLINFMTDVLNVGRKPSSVKFQDIQFTKTEDANGYTTLSLSSKVTNDKK